MLECRSASECWVTYSLSLVTFSAEAAFPPCKSLVLFIQCPTSHNSSRKMTDVSGSAASANLSATFQEQSASYAGMVERKRGRDDVGGADGKRVKVESDESTVLKMLLPHELAGRVIGKGGSVIKQIIDDSGAKVRLSETDEVIPETGERIIMAMGTPEAVALVADYLMAILNEPPPGEVVDPSAAKPLKILVPEMTTGSVIGKNGAVIKELMEASGANIRVRTPPFLPYRTCPHLFQPSTHALHAQKLYSMTAMNYVMQIEYSSSIISPQSL